MVKKKYLFLQLVTTYTAGAVVVPSAQKGKINPSTSQTQSQQSLAPMMFSMQVMISSCPVLTGIPGSSNFCDTSSSSLPATLLGLGLGVGLGHHQAGEGEEDGEEQLHGGDGDDGQG